MTSLRDTAVRTDGDLEDFWRGLLGPLGFARRGLWIAFVEDDGRILRQIVEIGDLPVTPAPDEIDGFASTMAGLRDELGVGRLAFLLVRPGRGAAARPDRAWAAALHAAAHDARVRCELVHLATDTDLVPLPVDDLLTRAAR